MAPQSAPAALRCPSRYCRAAIRVMGSCRVDHECAGAVRIELAPRIGEPRFGRLDAAADVDDGPRARECAALDENGAYEVYLELDGSEVGIAPELREDGAAHGAVEQPCRVAAMAPT